MALQRPRNLAGCIAVAAVLILLGVLLLTAIGPRRSYLAASGRYAADTARRHAQLVRDKEENFRLGEELSARGKHLAASTAYRRVVAVDPNYRDVRARLASARAAAGEAAQRQASSRQGSREADQRASTVQAAARKAAEARELLASKDCDALARADALLRDAERADPSLLRTAAERAQLVEARLACPMGEHDLRLALRILARQPLTLEAWLHNDSDRPHVADPAQFTLVTDGGLSMPCTAIAAGGRQPFPKLTLAPRTRTGGVISCPCAQPARSLVYQDLVVRSGTLDDGRVERELPDAALTLERLGSSTP